MAKGNVELVARVYEAAGRRDAVAVFELYHPDVELDARQLPLGQLMGNPVRRGHEGVRSLFREIHEAWDDLTYDVRELAEVGSDRVLSVVTRRGRGKRSGVEVAVDVAVLWTLREGRVVGLRWFSTREQALAALAESPKAAAHSQIPAGAEDIETLVRDAYETFNRDRVPFPQLWHPDGVYVNSSDDPDAGTQHGLEAISRLSADWIETYPDLTVEPLEIRVNGNCAFVWTRWAGRGGSSGLPIEMQLAHCWTFEEGKIRRIEEFFDRAEAMAAAGV